MSVKTPNRRSLRMRMPPEYFVAVGALWLLPVAGWASDQPRTSLPVQECGSCHTCSAPTRDEPCLRPCGRTATSPIAKALPPVAAPEVVVLDELEDRYHAVPFDHKGHAGMADMTQGCVVCHHYTPEGTAHPACKTCHAVALHGADIRKPGLKGAYHRQCLNCHREWSAENHCNVCHRAKTGVEEPPPGTSATPDDIIGRMHPPIPEPGTDVFAPSSGSQAGTKVVFYHADHIHRFGLACVECHHEDGCTRCHSTGASRAPRTPTLAEHHQPCARCHDTAGPEGCSSCHWREGTPRPGRFDHSSKGFALEGSHGKVGCRACHEGVPFSKLDRNCNACHAEWKPGAFNHAVTRQVLDVVHVGFDCESCHVDRRFDRPPGCDSCHEEGSGVSFPSRRPGPMPSP